MRARNRPLGVLFVGVAVLLGLFAGISFAQPFLPPSGLHAATIVASGNQVITDKYHQHLAIPIVKVQLDTGTTFTVESTPLAKLARRNGLPLSVQAQLDGTGFPKRIRYRSTWYGAAPPVWFWLGFGVALAALAALLGRLGLRWARTPRLAGA